MAGGRGGYRVRGRGACRACRRSARDRRLLPHRPGRHSQREAMQAFRTLGILTGLAAAFANLAGAAPGQAASAISTAGDRCPARATAMLVQGSTLCVSTDDPTQALRPQLLRGWIERSAHIVADYYGHFPAPLVELRIRAAPGGGVGGGRTTNESGLVIQMSVGREVTADELTTGLGPRRQIVHFLLPEIGRRHN